MLNTTLGITLDSLYANIGGKLKGFAKWIFIVGAIASVIGALVIIATAEYAVMIFVGLMALIVGPIVSWVSSWLLYGFGEMLDTLDVIAYNTYKDTNEKPAENTNEEASPKAAAVHFCMHCGNRLTADCNFCDRCGAKIVR